MSTPLFDIRDGYATAEEMREALKIWIKHRQDGDRFWLVGITWYGSHGSSHGQGFDLDDLGDLGRLLIEQQPRLTGESIYAMDVSINQLIVVRGAAEPIAAMDGSSAAVIQFPRKWPPRPE